MRKIWDFNQLTNKIKSMEFIGFQMELALALPLLAMGSGFHNTERYVVVENTPDRFKCNFVNQSRLPGFILFEKIPKNKKIYNKKGERFVWTFYFEYDYKSHRLSDKEIEDFLKE